MIGSRGSFTLRTMVLGALWVLLTEGSIASWTVGAPFVLGAAWVSRSLRFLPPWQISVLGVMRFFGFFVVASFRAGLDVAWRAIKPGRLDLAPAVIDMPTSVPSGAPRTFLLNAISLLPGTLSVAWDGNILLVHALDARTAVADDLRRLESHVGRAVRHEITRKA